MEERIQATLDAQWDALESRDKNIVNVRSQLASLLDDLALQKTDELEDIDNKLTANTEFISKAERAQTERDELQSHMQELKQSDIGKQIDGYLNQIRSIDNEIAKLMEQKSKIEQETKSLETVYSSRSAKYVSAITDLDCEFPPKQLQKVAGKREDVVLLNKRRSDVTKELNAVSQGGELWHHVCQELIELDREIKGCTRAQLPQISFILTKGANKIEECLDKASQAGWSLLVIAIGHELQLLHDTIEAVKVNEVNK